MSSRMILLTVPLRNPSPLSSASASKSEAEIADTAQHDGCAMVSSYGPPGVRPSPKSDVRVGSVHPPISGPSCAKAALRGCANSGSGRPPSPATNGTSERCHKRSSEPYSITSSALSWRNRGTSRPSAFAVFMLMTNSYLVGICTGRSAGFVPRRIRST
jgi:hypothetical protein